MESKVTERPILFSTLMVQRILSGQLVAEHPKTQTRRVINFARNPLAWDVSRSCFGVDGYDVASIQDGRSVIQRVPWSAAAIRQYFRCPYGEPGDRLWVREAFCYCGLERKDGTDRVAYRATEDSAAGRAESLPPPEVNTPVVPE
jgi:hypothetical protein